MYTIKISLKSILLSVPKEWKKEGRAPLLGDGVHGGGQVVHVLRGDAGHRDTAVLRQVDRVLRSDLSNLNHSSYSKLVN